jgi:hypothetical protein
MADLTPIAGKLGSLIRLLSSDQPGEVVTAGSAIGRLLARIGADFHVLADRLINGGGGGKSPLTKEEMQRLYDTGFEDGLALKQAAQDDGFHHTNGSTARTGVAIIRFCHDYRDRCYKRPRARVYGGHAE